MNVLVLVQSGVQCSAVKKKRRYICGKWEKVETVSLSATAVLCSSSQHVSHSLHSRLHHNVTETLAHKKERWMKEGREGSRGGGGGGGDWGTMRKERKQVKRTCWGGWGEGRGRELRGYVQVKPEFIHSLKLMTCYNSATRCTVSFVVWENDSDIWTVLVWLKRPTVHLQLMGNHLLLFETTGGKWIQKLLM